jgi:hypothetical protein
MIVEPGHAARRARRKIVAADHRGIAAGAVGAAIARSPRAPALLEARRLRWRLEHLGVAERDVVRQRFALGRKAQRGAGRAGNAASAVNEGIEHDAEELVRHLKCALLRPGCASPDTCESAVPRLLPGRRNRFPKPGVSVPPLLK